MKIPAEPGTRVLLIRHGRTEWNRTGRLMGRADLPLDDLGRAQADGLPGLLGKLGPTALWSSPLARARQTAEPLGRALGLEVRTDPRWVEVDVGRLEGLTWGEVEERHPEFRARLHRAPGTTPRPAGESDEELRDRGVAGLTAVMQAGPGSCSAVVSHGGTIRSVFAWVLGVPLGDKWRLAIDNASVSCVEMTERGLIVAFVNLTRDAVEA